MKREPADRLSWDQAMHRFLFIPFVLLLAVGACGGSSPMSPSGRGPATLYVSTSGNDANAGTIGSPWLTIRYALGQLIAGDILYVRAGTYNDRIFEENFTHTGTSWDAGRYITIAGYRGETVTITPNWENIVRFQDGSIHHVLIRDLVLDAMGPDHVDIVALGTAGGTTHDIHLENLEIKNAWANGILGSGSHYEFRNLNVHSNGREGILEGVYKHANGAYLAVSDSLVTGGRYWDNESYGVRIGTSALNENDANTIVEGVECYGNGLGLGLSGLSPANGGGIILGDVNNIARNNTLHHNETGLTFYGFSGKTATGLRAYNNTIYGNSVGINVENQSGPVIGAQIGNNILHSNGTDVVDNGSGTVR